MRAFLERYLPPRERNTALWLVLGGAGVSALAGGLGQMVMAAMPVGIDAADGGIPLGGAYAVQALAEFALVTVVVAALIRFGRAPRALALFIVLAETLALVIGAMRLLISLVLTLGGSPDGAAAEATLTALSFGLLLPIALVLGAGAGAWVASTVSLARIKDAGFSGDEDQSAGLRRRPESLGLRFMGWEGRPPSGDALIAIALVATAVIPALVGLLGSSAFELAVPKDATEGTFLLFGALAFGAQALAWVPSAWIVVRRTGVASAWLMSLVMLIESVPWTIGILVDSGPSVFPGLLASTVVPAAGVVGAALLGTALALGRQPATLDASDPQDPDATNAPADTAGGSDG